MSSRESREQILAANTRQLLSRGDLLAIFRCHDAVTSTAGILLGALTSILVKRRFGITVSTSLKDKNDA